MDVLAPATHGRWLLQGGLPLAAGVWLAGPRPHGQWSCLRLAAASPHAAALAGEEDVLCSPPDEGRVAWCEAKLPCASLA